jgi:glyoxylase-like metal-dependent hydrolase (beta-lactamase superfamily II)
MEIRPGLHRIQAPLGERFVALYLFVGTESALLVDTGIRESITETFLPYLDSAGIDPGIVRWAVNTHCDFDHTGGNGALKAALPRVQLMAHRLDRRLTEDVQHLIDERYGEFRLTDGFDDPPETTEYLRSVTDLVPLDIALAGGEEFPLGGRHVRILHVPGHSPGHLAVVDPGNRAVAIGDATLGRSVPFADGRPAFPPTYRDVDSYVASIHELQALDADLVLTAHYPVYEGEAATFFLEDSEQYTREIDLVLADVLSREDGGLTTLELVRAAGDRLGPWGPDALDYAVFPVTGNLERMRNAGIVTQHVAPDGRRTWHGVVPA